MLIKNEYTKELKTMCLIVEPADFSAGSFLPSFESGVCKYNTVGTIGTLGTAIKQARNDVLSAVGTDYW